MLEPSRTIFIRFESCLIKQQENVIPRCIQIWLVGAPSLLFLLVGSIAYDIVLHVSVYSLGHGVQETSWSFPSLTLS